MKASLNPFASHNIHNLDFQFHQGNWNELTSKLKNLKYRAALVGPHGSGKTTLLFQIQKHLKQNNQKCIFLFINTKYPRLSIQQWSQIFSAIKTKSIILFDGADLLPKWYWNIFKFITQKSSGLIITSHQEGLLLTGIQTNSTTAIMNNILEELCETNAEIKQISHALFKKHHGNMHEILRHLYLAFSKK